MAIGHRKRRDIPAFAASVDEVYRARDTKLGREVAVKVLPDSFASDPERRALRAGSESSRL